MWNTVTTAACYHDRRTRPSPAADRFVFGRQDAPLPFVLPADTPTSRRSWRRAKLSDRPQDFLEQVARHRDLGHLKDDVPGMRDDLGADLDELLPQAGQRPA